MDREIFEVHVLPLKSDEFPASQSRGEHARAGCRAQETSRRPTIAGRVDKARSGYNKGTIRADIRYLVVSRDVRRHRLISSGYTLYCHGYFLKPEPGLPAPFLNCSVFHCLDTKVFESLETILHGFEFFSGVPRPIPDLAYDTERYESVGLPGYLVS